MLFDSRSEIMIQHVLLSGILILEEIQEPYKPLTAMRLPCCEEAKAIHHIKSIW